MQFNEKIDQIDYSDEEINEKISRASRVADPEPKSEFTQISNDYFGRQFFKWQVCESKDGYYAKGPFFWREGILAFCSENGFMKFWQDLEYILVRVENNIVEIVTHAIIRDVCKAAIEPIECVYNFRRGEDTICLPLKYEKLELAEEFDHAQHTIFNHNWLGMLTNLEGNFLRDTNKECYFLFLDLVLRVEPDKTSLLEYEQLNALVWKKNIIQRFAPIHVTGRSIISDFFANIAGGNLLSLLSGLGYLMVSHNDPSTPKAVFLVDFAPPADNEPNGGTGKGLIGQSLAQTRKVTTIDGKQYDPENRFCWSLVTLETRIVFLDDVLPGFSPDFLNTILTEGFTVERKFQNAFFIPPAEAPKFLISSNYAIDQRGTTRKRRQHIVELTDFYSKQIAKGEPFPVRKTHGCTFFSSDWDAEEWARFDRAMIECVQLYFQHGLIKPEQENAKLRFFIQETEMPFAKWAFYRYRSFTPIEWDAVFMTEDERKEEAEKAPFKRNPPKEMEYPADIELADFIGATDMILKRSKFYQFIILFAEACNCTFSERRSNNTPYFKIKCK